MHDKEWASTTPDSVALSGKVHARAGYIEGIGPSVAPKGDGLVPTVPA